jgi:hypothetical protein
VAWRVGHPRPFCSHQSNLACSPFSSDSVVHEEVPCLFRDDRIRARFAVVWGLGAVKIWRSLSVTTNLGYYIFLCVFFFFYFGYLSSRHPVYHTEILGFRTLSIVRCYTPSSEPYSFYSVYVHTVHSGWMNGEATPPLPFVFYYYYLNCKWVFNLWQWYYNKTQHTNNTHHTK